MGFTQPLTEKYALQSKKVSGKCGLIITHGWLMESRGNNISWGYMAIYPTFTGGEEGIRCGKIDTSTTEKDRGSQFPMPDDADGQMCHLLFLHS